MSRRTIKKLLRRAEQAMIDGRYADAEAVYQRMFDTFANEKPSLLDHAGCLYGLIQSLFAQGRDAEAMDLADSAGAILSGRMELTLAA